VQYALLSINVSCRYQPKLVTNLGDVRFADVRDGESLAQSTMTC
jgi:hypothetical protein